MSDDLSPEEYKKVNFYTCMDCGDLGHDISEILSKCNNCRVYVCKKKIYIGVQYSSIHEYKKKISCFNCISNDKFINKKENKYIIEFCSPQFFNRSEWYKKTDNIK